MFLGGRVLNSNIHAGLQLKRDYRRASPLPLVSLPFSSESSFLYPIFKQKNGGFNFEVQLPVVMH